jgi:hypothetical protein
VGQVRGHGVHCACRPCGVHSVAHVLVLDVRPSVLRGNIPDHRVLGCWCVGLMRTLVPLRGGICDIRPSLEFGP